MNYTFCAPTLFGLEGIVADELRFHGKLDNVTAEMGASFSRAMITPSPGQT